ncbi:MAG: hypothetical protein NUV52_01590 [Candidatus Roizmanbacteria bacterium]|nr:hypothetical protein [Candidatus Roizmanbacteria bacterium]
MVDNKELISQQVPIHLRFGRHSDKDVAYATRFLNEVGDQFNHSEGNLYYIMEQALFPDFLSKRIAQTTAHVFDPKIAFGEAAFICRQGRPPYYRKELEFFLRRYKFRPFEEAQLNGLRTLWNSKPGRVRLIVEPTSAEELDNAHGYDGFESELDMTLQLLGQGCATEALPHFKQSIQFLVQESAVRNKTIAQVIKDIVATPSTDASLIVGYFGSNHTPIRHQLVKDGFGVNSKFDTEPGEAINYYGPFDILVRKLMFNLEMEIEPFDWYRGMCFLLTKAFDEGRLEQSETPYSRSQIQKKMVDMTIDRFPSMEEVNQFMASIKMKGPEAATATLFET